MSIAVVSWSGNYGGAETWSLSLAASLKQRGMQTGIVIIGGPGPICERAERAGIPQQTLGLPRGSAVMFHTRTFSDAVTRAGRTAAIVPSAGYLSAALRAGGYGGRIIAVEHGCVLQLGYSTWHQRVIRGLDRLSGLWAVDAQVTPSKALMREVLRHPHCKRVVQIPLAVALSSYSNSEGDRDKSPSPSGELVVGFAGRLIPGKGLDVILRALAAKKEPPLCRLEVAGDGPRRPELQDLANELGIASRVRFRGWVQDMPSFWRDCDVAVVPSNQFIESFGMVAVEAMACGKPVIAARNGGLAETVVDGETGALFEPGNWCELAELLAEYSRDPTLRLNQGKAARVRCLDTYNIDHCAEEFESLIRSLA
jgi:glycosyltransferase involved in cell wall biosynthesis